MKRWRDVHIKVNRNAIIIDSYNPSPLQLPIRFIIVQRALHYHANRPCLRPSTRQESCHRRCHDTPQWKLKMYQVTANNRSEAAGHSSKWVGLWGMRLPSVSIQPTALARTHQQRIACVCLLNEITSWTQPLHHRAPCGRSPPSGTRGARPPRLP